MSAPQALQAAHAAGVQVRIGGDDLLLEAAVPPPAEVVDLLSRNKTGILGMLRSGADGWSAQDWQIFFEERAAIVEFDQSVTRPQAEQYAFACCIAEWLNRHPVSSAPGRCLWCAGAHHEHDPLLPYGVEPTGYAWLHLRCWEAWYAARKREAVAALKAMGLATE